MNSSKLLNPFSLERLPELGIQEIDKQHEQEVFQLLPILGSVFGFVVVLFNIWDHFIDPSHAWLTLSIRISLVALGAIAYFPTVLSWTAIQRCGFIYWTHVSAIIFSSYLLKDGLLYGLGGITACVFSVSVITHHLKTFFTILSVPTLLFAILASLSMNNISTINCLMMYLFALGNACIVMLVMSTFRKKSFLFEQQLLHLSRHDSLTGANNRAYLIELGEQSFSLAKRHSRSLAVAMIDIDHFKKINDSYGHDIGDLVIRELANTCLQQLRQADHFGRLGGEEFVFILPETEQEEAVLCMERVRKSIEKLSITTTKGPLQFTVSVGIAMLEQHHVNWAMILKDADTAMYAAKHAGRNRIELAPSLS